MLRRAPPGLEVYRFGFPRGRKPPAYHLVYQQSVKDMLFCAHAKRRCQDGIAPRKPATALMSVLTVALSSVAVKHMQYIGSYKPMQALAVKRIEAVACLPRFRPGFSVSDYAYRIPELANSIPDCRFILSDWLLRFCKQPLSVKNLSLTFGPV